MYHCIKKEIELQILQWGPWGAHTHHGATKVTNDKHSTASHHVPTISRSLLDSHARVLSCVDRNLRQHNLATPLGKKDLVAQTVLSNPSFLPNWSIIFVCHYSCIWSFRPITSTYSWHCIRLLKPIAFYFACCCINKIKRKAKFGRWLLYRQNQLDLWATRPEDQD